MNTSPLIPDYFFEVQYNTKRIPGVEDQSDLSLGANCQVFAYELLRVNGLQVKNHRSSELWEDECYSTHIKNFQALDLMLYNKTKQAYGAHLAVYLGASRVIHLSKDIGKAEITYHESLLKQAKYAHFIGAKRIGGNISPDMAHK